jgi:molybdopterin/thiamine biosynthesis adenylyltransferase/rhodanese-related sulfurtransferase
MNPNLSPEEITRYSRHILIPEVGFEGQQKLKAASVLLVGAGGLGSPVGMYLAGAGVGRIGIVDADVVDVSNLQRQVIHGTSGVGELKVESARQRMLDINPHIQVDIYPEAFTSANAMRIAKDYTFVVDCTDNFPARYLISDLCVLQKKPFVYGAIFRFEGQVSVFDADQGPCYRCLFPDPPSPELAPSCAQTGVFGVLPGTIGALQASEVVKLILGIGTPLIGKLLIYNALDPSFDIVKLRKDPHCKTCGEQPEITHLIDYDQFCGLPGAAAANAPAITPREVAEALRLGRPIRLIDVRNEREGQIASIKEAEHIPLDQLEARLSELNLDDEIVVFCRVEPRAVMAQQLLLRRGYRNIKRMSGGIKAWAKEIDPTIPLY